MGVNLKKDDSDLVSSNDLSTRMVGKTDFTNEYPSFQPSVSIKFNSCLPVGVKQEGSLVHRFR
jgi:uncharacterized protein (DUF2344 family)